MPVNRPTAGTPSPAMARFLSSMAMDFDKWHDGIGYDLAALDELDATETNEIVGLLIARIETGHGDWFDLEVLQRVQTPAARAALIGALQNENASMRLRAAEYLADEGEDPGHGLTAAQLEDVQKEIAALLRRPRTEVGIDLLMRLAEQFNSLVIREALLWCALDGSQDLRVHAAALSLYLAGGAPEAFDWEQRPLFLEFGEKDRNLREAAMKELMRRIDVARQKSAPSAS